MANSFDSNITRKLARVFLAEFESARVLSKNVNTQLLSGKFNPASGAYVDFKRPTDYTTYRNSTGDLTSHTDDNIITGKATGTVQDYFTVSVNFDEADEAIQMDQLDELLRPMATRIKTDLELDFAAFMKNNSALMAGTYGTPATTWDHIAEAGAMMQAAGIPMDAPWCYAVNPFTQRNLASNQRSLGAGGAAGGMISEAHKQAIITQGFAGFDKVLTATTLASNTISSDAADRAGALTSAAIDVTYATHKDSMEQTIYIDGITAAAGGWTIKAGERVQIAGRNMLNLNTRQLIVDENGGNVLFTGVVTTDATVSTSGTATLKVSGPAIYSTAGGSTAFNTVDSALTNNDVVTLLGSASDVIQPNIFWHRDAFAIGSVPMKKLYSTDTIATTEDGLQIRVSKGADFTKNQQKVRFDLRPAYAVLNPFFAGHGFGTA